MSLNANLKKKNRSKSISIIPQAYVNIFSHFDANYENHWTVVLISFFRNSLLSLSFEFVISNRQLLCY